MLLLTTNRKIIYGESNDTMTFDLEWKWATTDNFDPERVWSIWCTLCSQAMCFVENSLFFSDHNYLFLSQTAARFFLNLVRTEKSTLTWLTVASTSFVIMVPRKKEIVHKLLSLIYTGAVAQAQTGSTVVTDVLPRDNRPPLALFVPRALFKETELLHQMLVLAHRRLARALGGWLIQLLLVLLQRTRMEQLKFGIHQILLLTPAIILLLVYPSQPSSLILQKQVRGILQTKLPPPQQVRVLVLKPTCVRRCCKDPFWHICTYALYVVCWRTKSRLYEKEKYTAIRLGCLSNHITGMGSMAFYLLTASVSPAITNIC